MAMVTVILERGMGVEMGLVVLELKKSKCPNWSALSARDHAATFLSRLQSNAGSLPSLRISPSGSPLL